MCEALADTRVLCIRYRPMEIGIRLLSYPSLFLSRPRSFTNTLCTP